MFSQVASDAAACDAPDLCADLLDGRHQRIRKHHGPEQPIAELRSDLGIRRNAAWVVIGRPRHQPRPQRLQQSEFCRALRRRLLPGVAGIHQRLLLGVFFS